MPRLLTSTITLLLTAGSLVHADEPLQTFGTETDVLIRLAVPEATIEKVAGLAEGVQAGFGDMVRQQGPMGLGQGLQVPGLKGVDQSRDVWVAVFAAKEGEPNVVVGLPATNADAVVSALPDRAKSRVAGDWVYYTITRADLPQPAQSGASISSLLTGEPEAVFDSGDLSVFINIKHLKETFADEIAHGRQQVQGVIQQIGQAVQQQQQSGMNMQPIMEMYGSMFECAFQAVEDAAAASAAVTVSDAGVQVEEYVQFVDGSATAEKLASHPTSAFQTLAQLPPDGFVNFGISCDMDGFMEWGWEMNAMMLGDDPETREKFDAAMEGWKGITFKTIVGSFTLGNPATGLFQYSAIAQATPVKAIRKNMLGMMDVLGEIEAYGMKQTMTVEQDAEEISGKSIDLFTVKQEVDPQMDPTGAQRMMQSMMFGPDGMVSRLAYFDDYYVQVMGGGSEAMKAAIDAAQNPTTMHRPEGLLDESNLAVLIDLPRLVTSALQTASGIPGVNLPVDGKTLANLQFETSYVGVTMRGEPSALRSKTSVPVEQLRGVMMLVGLFQAAGQ